MKLTLYDFPKSSASFRTRIACGLKGIDPTEILVNFRTSEQSSPAYKERVPSGLVPALVLDDDTALSQSIAIIRYLDHIAPELRLIPKGFKDEARVLEFALTIACDIHPLNNLRILKYLRSELGQPEAAVNAWYRHWVETGFSTVEELLSRYAGRFAVGDDLSLADICLVPQVFNARRYDVDLTPFPRITALDEQLQSIPEFAAAKPSLD
ncbi:MAG: maleylacetoacetate isomerase [Pacificimonas sp.]|nr:maleylacetoacetate isomerase [Pacificimonas sp.]